jgi:hypothetical protein
MEPSGGDMPFANKYRFAMRFPEPGDRVAELTVESCEVSHEEHGDGTIRYPISMVLAGPGGRQGVSKALRACLDHGHTTFSGFGNPYQLRFGRFAVESLGAGRYRVTGCGTGVRFDLERELRRFATYARLHDRTANEALIPDYVEAYKRDVTRRKPELEY